MLFKASAPGSMMLLGEYAVLQGKTALIAAVDKRVTVTLSPRSDDKIIINSDRYETLIIDRKHLTVKAPFQFVLASLYLHRKKIKAGCEITIRAEFSDQVGLGSSAAVTVATLAVLFTWLKASFTTLELIHEARRVIRYVQGAGSGADAAASVMGKIVAYSAAPLTVEQFSVTPSLTVIYSGSKTPTSEAIKRVKENFTSSTVLFKTLCLSIHHCVKEGILALREQNWSRFGATMNIQQGLMQALGVSTPILNKLIGYLREQPALMGAKISGSGWGDCVIGLGEAELPGLREKYAGTQEIKVKIAEQGLVIESLKI